MIHRIAYSVDSEDNVGIDVGFMLAQQWADHSDPIGEVASKIKFRSEFLTRIGSTHVGVALASDSHEALEACITLFKAIADYRFRVDYQDYDEALENLDNILKTYAIRNEEIALGNGIITATVDQMKFAANFISL